MANNQFPILVAEDNEDDADLLQAALRWEGITNPVHIATDGQAAIDYLAGNGQYHDRQRFPLPKFIFCDIKMPRMNGFEVLNWLRNHSLCKVMPVIMLTSSNEDSDINRAYQLGANAYFVKPSQVKELQELLKSAFNFWSWCQLPLVRGNC